MIYGLWQSAQGLQAQEYRQAMIANNLANAETPGFKPDRVAFQDRLSAAQAGLAGPSQDKLGELSGGLFATPVYTDFRPATVTPTANPLDVAVDGDGFLTVRTAEGVRFTRDGRFITDAKGKLLHLGSGGEVVDPAGQPIVLNPESKGTIKIDSTGRIQQGDVTVGRLALTDFSDRARLEKVGANLFDGEHASAVQATGRIRQSAVEASGVEATTTLVEMIAASRAYEMNASMLSMQDQTLGKAVNDVGRIG